MRNDAVEGWEKNARALVLRIEIVVSESLYVFQVPYLLHSVFGHVVDIVAVADLYAQRSVTMPVIDGTKQRTLKSRMYCLANTSGMRSEKPPTLSAPDNFGIDSDAAETVIADATTARKTWRRERSILNSEVTV